MNASANPQPVIIDNKTHIIIKNALSKEICELVASYANFKAAALPNAKSDVLGKNIHREYGDALMETLLVKLTPLIEQATKLALWPTLSFYYTYKNGNQLQRHKDRTSCQIVAGLCIGADEEYKAKQGQPSAFPRAGRPGQTGTTDLDCAARRPKHPGRRTRTQPPRRRGR